MQSQQQRKIGNIEQTLNPELKKQFPLEWKNLQKLFITEKTKQILKDLIEVINNLQDTKTVLWQVRTDSMKAIQTIFIDINEIIWNETDIIEVFQDKFTSLLEDQQKEEYLFEHTSQKSDIDNSKTFFNHPSNGKLRKNIHKYLISWLQRIIQPFLMIQLKDIRASVVKECCALIIWISKEFKEVFGKECILPKKGSQASPRVSNLTQRDRSPSALSNNEQTANPQNQIGGNGVNYFNEDGIPRLITSGNKLQQEIGHQSILEILEKGSFIQNILYSLIPLVNNKNAMTRLRNAEYFNIILTNALGYNTDGISKLAMLEYIEENQKVIEYFLIRSVGDQNDEVKDYAFRCISLYKQLMPQKCINIIRFAISNTSIKKKLIQDLDVQMERIEPDEEFEIIDRINKIRLRFDKAKTSADFKKIKKRDQSKKRTQSRQSDLNDFKNKRIPNANYDNTYQRRVSYDLSAKEEIRNYKTAAIPRKHSSPQFERNVRQKLIQSPQQQYQRDTQQSRLSSRLLEESKFQSKSSSWLMAQTNDQIYHSRVSSPDGFPNSNKTMELKITKVTIPQTSRLMKNTQSSNRRITVRDERAQIPESLKVDTGHNFQAMLRKTSPKERKRHSKVNIERPQFTLYNNVNPSSPTPNNVKSINERASPRNSEAYTFDAHSYRESKVQSSPRKSISRQSPRKSPRQSLQGKRDSNAHLQSLNGQPQLFEKLQKKYSEIRFEKNKILNQEKSMTGLNRNSSADNYAQVGQNKQYQLKEEERTSDATAYRYTFNEKKVYTQPPTPKSAVKRVAIMINDPKNNDQENRESNLDNEVGQTQNLKENVAIKMNNEKTYYFQKFDNKSDSENDGEPDSGQIFKTSPALQVNKLNKYFTKKKGENHTLLDKINKIQINKTMKSDMQISEKTRNSSNKRFSSKPLFEGLQSTMSISPEKERNYSPKSKRLVGGTAIVVSEEKIISQEKTNEDFKLKLKSRMLSPRQQKIQISPQKSSSKQQSRNSSPKNNNMMTESLKTSLRASSRNSSPRDSQVKASKMSNQSNLQVNVEIRPPSMQDQHVFQATPASGLKSRQSVTTMITTKNITSQGNKTQAVPYNTKKNNTNVIDKGASMALTDQLRKMKIEKPDDGVQKNQFKVQNQEIASQMSQLEISILEAKEQIMARNQQIIVKSNKDVDIAARQNQMSSRRGKNERKTPQMEVDLSSNLDLHKQTTQNTQRDNSRYLQTVEKTVDSSPLQSNIKINNSVITDFKMDTTDDDLIQLQEVQTNSNHSFEVTDDDNDYLQEVNNARFDTKERGFSLKKPKNEIIKRLAQNPNVMIEAEEVAENHTGKYILQNLKSKRIINKQYTINTMSSPVGPGSPRERSSSNSSNGRQQLQLQNLQSKRDELKEERLANFNQGIKLYNQKKAVVKITHEQALVEDYNDIEEREDLTLSLNNIEQLKKGEQFNKNQKQQEFEMRFKELRDKTDSYDNKSSINSITLIDDVKAFDQMDLQNRHQNLNKKNSIPKITNLREPSKHIKVDYSIQKAKSPPRIKQFKNEYSPQNQQILDFGDSMITQWKNNKLIIMESPRNRSPIEFDQFREVTESPRFPISNQSAKNNGNIYSPRFSKIEESMDSRKTPKFEKSQQQSPRMSHQSQFSTKSRQSTNKKTTVNKYDIIQVQLSPRSPQSKQSSPKNLYKMFGNTSSRKNK